MKFLFLAYGILFGAIALYVFYLSRKQKALSDELEKLEN